MYDTKLSKRILEARKSKELGIRGVAEMIGISVVDYARIEIGTDTIQSEKLLNEFAFVLDIPIDELRDLWKNGD